MDLKVLVVGSGGREHALVRVLAQSPQRPQILVAPGNPGIAQDAVCHPINVADVDGLVALARAEAVALVVVGPELPLVLGLADRLRSNGIPVLGPSAAGARLEGSKTFAKQLMDRARVPTARWASFSEAESALRFSEQLGPRAVIKADGLASGKGVTVAETQLQSAAAIQHAFSGGFGDAGRTVVVEELLEGEELSVIALTDGERLEVLAPAQDHKRLLDGDLGPNTGGMGAYCPAPRGTAALLDEVKQTCLLPIVRTLAQDGVPYSGFLYAGLMLTADGPKVLEYNVRLGDPETQAILPRLAEDAFSLFLAAAQGQLPDRPLLFSNQAAVTVVLAADGYPGAPRHGQKILGLEDAARLPDVRIDHAGTQRSGPDWLTAGGRVLGVTGLGSDLEAAARRAYEAVGLIRWPGMLYRRDIAFRALGRSLGA